MTPATWSTRSAVATMSSRRIDVAAEAHVFPAAFLQSHLTVDGKTATAYNARGAPHDGAQNATWAPSGPPSAGGSCAGASAGCAGRLHTGRAADSVPCYGYRLEVHRTSLKNAAGRRWADWHDGDDNYRAALATALLVYSHGRQRAHNVAAPAFRINASGDVDQATAQAWNTALRSAAIAALEPALDVWLYSRSYGRGHGDGDALRLLLDRHGNPPPRCIAYLSSGEPAPPWKAPTAAFPSPCWPRTSTTGGDSWHSSEVAAPRPVSSRAPSTSGACRSPSHAAAAPRAPAVPADTVSHPPTAPPPAT